MSIPVGDEQLSTGNISTSINGDSFLAMSSGDVSIRDNESPFQSEEIVYDYVGTNLNMTKSSRLSIELDDMLNAQNITRSTKRMIVRFIIKNFIAPLFADNKLDLDRQFFIPDTAGRWI